MLHDLKNCVSMLSLVAQNAGTAGADPTFQRDAFRTVGESVRKMRELIDRLSHLPKGLELRLAPTDLNGVARQAVEGTRLAVNGRIRLAAELHPLPPIAADPEKAADNYRKLLALEPDVDTRAEAKRRLADLNVQIEDTRGNTDDSAKSIKESIKFYNELLNDRPEDPKNDRVFYQLARAYQNIGDVGAAIDTLRRLTERHPDSDLAGDAHFRRAELLFLTKQYAEAEASLQRCVEIGGPAADKAQSPLASVRRLLQAQQPTGEKKP
jgi:tetratricopeptide (TPR) repeat protein